MRTQYWIKRVQCSCCSPSMSRTENPNGHCHMPAPHTRPHPAAKDIQKTSVLSFQPLQSHRAKPNVPCASEPSYPTSHVKSFTHVHMNTLCHQPSQTAEHARHAKPSCAYPTSHATAVPKLRPRIRFFLLCERPWSSASRCPQGSMVLCAWPDTQQNTNHHRHMASPCKATSQAKLQAMQLPPPPSAAAAAEAALTLPPAMPPCARAKAKPKDPILPALRTAMELSFQMPAGIDGAVRMAGHSAEYQSSPSHGQPLQSHQPSQAASQAAATTAKAAAAAAEAAGAAASHCRQSMPTQPASWR